MTSVQSDPVKQQVAAHWGRRAAHFDEDLGHSIRTAAERAAWDRILDLTLPAGDALDIGCGTGFLSLELALRGHLCHRRRLRRAGPERAAHAGGMARTLHPPTL